MSPNNSIKTPEKQRIFQKELIKQKIFNLNSFIEHTLISNKSNLIM